MLPKYPKIIPELNLHSSNQTDMNHKSIKHKLLSKFFQKRIEKDGLIYFYYHKSKKEEFMPLFTLTKSLALYNDYIDSKDPKYLEEFKKLSKVLIDEMEADGRMNGWKHKKSLQLPGYPPIKRSYSALFNGRGLWMLIRYYDISKDKDIISKIDQVLNTFLIQSDKWWVMKKEWNDTWYLEYSYWNNSPVVFNWLFSAFVWLYEVYLYWPEEVKQKAKDIFDKWIDTFKRNSEKSIYNWKFFDWFRYDDNKLYFADGDYGDIETKQMKCLFELTWDKELEKIYKKYKNIYEKNKFKAWIYEWYYFLKKRFYMK